MTNTKPHTTFPPVIRDPPHPFPRWQPTQTVTVPPPSQPTSQPKRSTIRPPSPVPSRDILLYNVRRLINDARRRQNMSPLYPEVEKHPPRSPTPKDSTKEYERGESKRRRVREMSEEQGRNFGCSSGGGVGVAQVSGDERMREILAGLPKLSVKGLEGGKGKEREELRVCREIDWNRQEQFWKQLRMNCGNLVEQTKGTDGTKLELKEEVQGDVQKDVEKTNEEKNQPTVKAESSGISKCVCPGAWVPDDSPKNEPNQSSGIEVDPAEIPLPICPGAWVTDDNTPDPAFATAPLIRTEHLPPSYQPDLNSENPELQELRRSESEARQLREERIRERQLLVQTEKKLFGSNSKKGKDKVVLDLGPRSISEKHWNHNAIEHAGIAALAAVTPSALLDKRKEFPFPDVEVEEVFDTSDIKSEPEAQPSKDMPGQSSAFSSEKGKILEPDDADIWKASWKKMDQRLKREAAEVESAILSGDEEVKNSVTSSRRNSPPSVDTTGPVTPVSGIDVLKSAQQSLYQATVPSYPVITMPGQDQLDGNGKEYSARPCPPEPTLAPKSIADSTTINSPSVIAGFQTLPSPELSVDDKFYDGEKSSRTPPKSVVNQLREAQATLRAVTQTPSETLAAPPPREEKTTPLSSLSHSSIFPPTTSPESSGHSGHNHEKATLNPSSKCSYKEYENDGIAFSSPDRGPSSNNNHENMDAEIDEQPSAMEYKKTGVGRRKLGSAKMRQLTEASLELIMKMKSEETSHDEAVARRASLNNTTFRKVDFKSRPVGGKLRKYVGEERVELSRHNSSPLTEECQFQNSANGEDLDVPDSPTPRPHKLKRSLKDSSVSPRTRSIEQAPQEFHARVQEICHLVEVSKEPFSFTNSPEFICTRKPLVEEEAPASIPARNPQRRSKLEQNVSPFRAAEWTEIPRKPVANLESSEAESQESVEDEEDEELEKLPSEAEWLANPRIGTAEFMRVEKPRSGITLVHVSGSNSSKRSSMPSMERNRSRRGSSPPCPNSDAATMRASSDSNSSRSAGSMYLDLPQTTESSHMKPPNRTPPCPPYSSTGSFTRTCTSIDLDDDGVSTPGPARPTQSHIPIRVLPKQATVVVQNPYPNVISAPEGTDTSKHHKRVDSKDLIDPSASLSPDSKRNSTHSSVSNTLIGSSSNASGGLSLRSVLKKKRFSEVEGARRGSRSASLFGPKSIFVDERMDAELRKVDSDQMSMMSSKTSKGKRQKVRRFFGMKKVKD